MWVQIRREAPNLHPHIISSTPNPREPSRAALENGFGLLAVWSGIIRDMLVSLFRGLLAGVILCAALLAGFAAVQAQSIAAPLAEIITVTPMADGAIVHIVQQDETLATISEAYGVNMADIRALNGMAATSNLIFPGQKLIMRLALPPTETPTRTATQPRPTRTATIATPTRTPRATATATVTLTPTITPNPLNAALDGFMEQNQRSMLIAMIAACALGLIWTVWGGFRKRK